MTRKELCFGWLTQWAHVKEIMQRRKNVYDNLLALDTELNDAYAVLMGIEAEKVSLEFASVLDC